MSILQILLPFIWCFFVYIGDTSGLQLEPYDGYLGYHLGEFQRQGSSANDHHNVAGTVYIVNDTTLLIEGFQYDGLARNATFWVGSSASPDRSGQIATIDLFDVPLPLSEYDPDENGEYVIIKLPRRINSFPQYRWLSVWCRTFLANFASVSIPQGVKVPQQVLRGSFNGPGVTSGTVSVVNNRQIRISNLNYYGSCPGEAYYWVGEGATVDASGCKALDGDLRANPLGPSHTFVVQDYTVTLPKGLSMSDINYLAVWCSTTSATQPSFNLGHTQIAFISNVPPYLELPYLGKYMGFFNFGGSVGRNSHRVRGTVYAVDEKTLFIKGFNFDGAAPFTYIWGSKSSSPSPDGDILSVDGIAPLGQYQNEDIIVRLGDKNIDVYGSISVYCRQAAANFASLTVLNDFEAPDPKELGPLTGPPGVSAREVTIVDQHTLHIKDLSINVGGAFFWVGVGNTPDAKGWKVFWEQESYFEFPDYDDGDDDDFGTFTHEDPRPIEQGRVMDLYVWLQGLTVFDIGYLSIASQSASFEQDISFAHILIPDGLDIPPFTEDGYGSYNCEVLKPHEFHVHWAVDEDEQEIEIILEGRIQLGEYLAFGVSGSDSRTWMIGSDVTVGWIEPLIQQSGFVQDYHLSARQPCVGLIGACPDPYEYQDVEYESAAYYDGIATISYTRPFDSGDTQYDKQFRIDRDVYISWAIGPVDRDENNNIYIKKHNPGSRPTGNHRINFGRRGSRCPLLPGGVSTLKPPWPSLHIFADSPTVFRATIGQAGGGRGYEGIVGRPGWGIAWYINGLLIPEITVKRGVTYTFEVYGGNGPLSPTNSPSATSHPFYITNDERGGYGQLTPPEQQDIEIYAGPVSGSLCEWSSVVPNSPDDFDNFHDYRDATLAEDCEQSSTPGTLVWTPGADTPDPVYYQCYTHRFLGWKIHVVDDFPECGVNEFECQESVGIRCLDIAKWCDGYVDCVGQEDEQNCPPCDPFEQHECEYIDEYRCIHNSRICDGYSDCATGEDEAINCECEDGYYECEYPRSDYGRCIDEHYLCDGEADCEDGADESPILHGCAGRNCDDGEFTCYNGLCVSEGYLCDGDNDCSDGSDEIQANCPACNEFQFTCDNGDCIPDYWECDGVADCQDESDESESYCDGRECSEFQFACDNGGCIPDYWVCDDDNDCGDYSDEVECDICGDGEFTCDNGNCNHFYWVCDGIDDCGDGSDEEESYCDGRECVEFEFMCGNGDCIPDYYVCDGENDCDDSSDEFPTNCLPPRECLDFEFTCDNGRCVPSSYICDGENNCLDNSDEVGCPGECSADEFMCDNGECIHISYWCDGFVQCGDSSDEARCGCSDGQFTCDNGQCIPDVFECDDYDDCGDNSDEGEDCQRSCYEEEFTCDNGACIPSSYICDSDNDCGDNSDEGAFCDELCGNSLPIEVGPTATPFFYQPPDSFLSSTYSCLWQVTAPPGYRVYIEVALYNGQGSLYFGPNPNGDYGGPGVPYYSYLDNYLDLVSPDTDNTLSFGLTASEPYADDLFVLNLSAVTDTTVIQTCTGFSDIQVLPANRVCDGHRDCLDATDEIELCPCPQGHVACTDQCTFDSITSPCPAYGPALTCVTNTCGQCTAQLYAFSGRRLTDAECANPDCAPNFFKCDEPSPGYFGCLPPEYVCDGESDCADAQDEDPIQNGCTPRDCNGDEFTCGNGLCIPEYYICDGDNDCGDNSDELNCPVCFDYQFTCDNGACIPESFVCDNDNDCGDFSDEVGCPSGCADNEFTCDNGNCVLNIWVCDGYDDCYDNSDEDECPGICGEGEFTCDNGDCIPDYWVCDGLEDCELGADEVEGYCDSRECSDLQFTCSNGDCIPDYWVCDGEGDCDDSSDEVPANCPLPRECLDFEFTCDNLRCVPESYVCDGEDDCSDNSDEEQQCGPSLPSVDVTTTLSLDLAFTPPLLDPTSIEFLQLQFALEQELENLFRLLFGDAFGEVTILGFRPGSVIPEFSIAFEYPPGGNSGTGSIEEQVITSIEQALQLLIASGTLGSYTVLPGPVPPITVDVSCRSDDEFLCGTSQLCISNSLKCDTVNDCGDASDEQDCYICPLGAPATTCPAIPCTPQACPGAATCQQEFCLTCKTLYFDGSGNPLTRCFDCPVYACTLEWNPQCGSDGVTYGNPCALAATACNDASLTLAYQGECTGQDICYEDIEIGPCDAAFPRWAYNMDQRQCILFSYGGCGGNDNRFETELECEMHCEDRELTDCQRRAMEADSLPLVGAYIPQCTPNGDYEPRQCHGSTGFCWCVNELGEELDGTRTAPGLPQVQCPNHILCVDLNGQPINQGREIPTTDPCVTCFCESGERLCAAVGCLPPQHEGCRPIPGTCCDFDCNHLCFNSTTGVPLPDGSPIPSSNPCEICSCYGFQLQCAIVDCPYPGVLPEGCQPIYRDDECCASYDHCFGCGDGEFTCDNGDCIPNYWVCDGLEDCEGGADEVEGYCDGRECSDLQFTCGNGDCIPDYWVCDGEGDCDDSSDEFPSNCPPPRECLDFEFTCDNLRCVPESYVCDGEDDCLDNSDEEQQCGPSLPSVDVITTLSLDLDFDPRLLDPTSIEFLQLQYALEQELENLFRLLFGDAFGEVTILGFRPGSVIPEFSIAFEYPPGGDSGTGSIEEQVIASIEQALQLLIASGTLGPYTVLPGPVPPITVDVSCSSDQFLCGTSQLCISNSLQCNSVNDCGDASDEQDCYICPLGAPVTTCPAVECRPQDCPGAATCQQEFCFTCKTLYFDGSGNPLTRCFECHIFACTLEWNPQCGSDGVTYGNPCALAAAVCTDPSLTLAYQGECTGQSICYQGIDIGPCEALFPRWGYDMYQQECIPFSYGGCEGNDNNFITELECEMQCEDRELTDCQRQAMEADSLPLVGAYIPQCTPNGDYEPRQCHASTGFCWCVNELGEELDGTRTGPGQPLVQCPNHILCVLNGQPINQGQEIPTTDPCVTCFCESGERLCVAVGCLPPQHEGCRPIPGTCCDFDCNHLCFDSTTGVPLPDGSPIPSSNPCEICSCYGFQLQCAIIDCPYPGVLPEGCQPIYRDDECCASYDHCFVSCVDQDGRPISEGQEIPTNDPCVTCRCVGGERECLAVDCAPPQHERCRHIPGTCCDFDCDYLCIDAAGNPLNGPIPSSNPCEICSCFGSELQCAIVDCFYPENLPEGCQPIYNDDQCCPSYDHCLGGCPQGVPTVDCLVDPCSIRGCPFDFNARCEANYCGGCFAQFFDSDGNPIPLCSDCPIDFCTAEYNPQCGSDGVTYGNPCELASAACTDSTLTLAHPGECRELTDCQRQAQLAGTPPLPGAYVPQCKPNGDYEPMQCHGSTGFCWCVNELGGELNGTRTAPGLPVVPCRDHIPCIDPYGEPINDGDVTTVDNCLTCFCGRGQRICAIIDCFYPPPLPGCVPIYREGECCPSYDHCTGCPEVCTEEYDPQCGSDGVTYSNPCYLTRAQCSDSTLILAYPGECSVGCPPGVPTVRCFADPCTVTSCPFYPNARCEANYCGGCFAHFYDANGNPITQCNDCPIQACTREYNPQCGSNGVTYGNPCELASAACTDGTLILAHPGVCTGPCDNDPCENGGTCVPDASMSTGYFCRCAQGYFGIRCQSVIPGGPCSSNPCLNGGICFPSSGGYRCTCLQGYTGVRCETSVPTGPRQPNVTATTTLSLGIDFTPDLFDNNSPGFVLLKFDLERLLEDIFSLQWGGAFNEAIILNFRPGSVIAEILIAFQYPPDPTFGPPGPIEEQIARTIQQVLSSLIASGTLGSYTLIPGPVPPVDVTVNCSSQAEFLCSNRHLCVPITSRCDSVNDCDDASDELNCGDNCLPGISTVQCLVDPCSFNTCPFYPNAQCVSSYCGGCFAIFYDVNGSPIAACNNCPIPNTACPPVVDYQCGSDGGTYGNPCRLALGNCLDSSLTLAYPGQCTGGDSCSSNPCLNGGVCSPSAFGYSCTCSQGFTGVRCETSVPTGSCDRNPCLNRATCIPSFTAAGYFCLCQQGYTGTRCESPIQGGPCSSNPCLNGGVCTPTASGYICTCPQDYTGERCQTPVSTGPCDSNPCYNGGSCRTTATGYICLCQLDYTGTRCESPVQGACNTNQCLNGGTCLPSTTGFVCRCIQGFTGTRCERPVEDNPCARQPCLNGGICTQMGSNMFMCQCRTGYTGRLCEIFSSGCTITCDTDEYDPQCGSDGETYANLCHLRRATSCHDPDLRLLYRGECRSGGCPPGVPTTLCFADPCVVNTCPSHPDAQCVANYCGGCYALFFDGYGNPIPQCSSCPIEHCNTDWEPQCGSNGVTYDNPCHLARAVCFDRSLRLTAPGECQSGCPFDACTAYYAPMCGTNGVTYTNECWLNVAICRDGRIELRHKGICRPLPPGCPIHECTEDDNPQCGSDGKTYRNPCYLRKQACDYPLLVLAYPGSCRSDCPTMDECPDEHDPQCGTDGATYPNLCQLELQVCRIPTLGRAHAGRCTAAPPPWPEMRVGATDDNKFLVEIGDSGGVRGYAGITGFPSPGISWYINGQLIPVITVQRNRYYIFHVYGGRDHGFYITNDYMGGYRIQSIEERQDVEIYAGPVTGPLCEYTATLGASPDGYHTFAQFSAIGLTKTCEDGEAALLVWKPDDSTPNVVYYQSYNERHVG